MAKGVKFTRGAAQRIVNATRQLERTPRDQTPHRGSYSGGSLAPFPVRLLSRSGAAFAWQEVRRNAGDTGWEDNPLGLSSVTTGLSAREANGRVDLPYGATTGLIVSVRHVPRNDSTDDLALSFHASLDPFLARLLTEVGSADYTFAQVDSDGTAISGGVTSASTGKNCTEWNGRLGIEAHSSTGAIVLITPTIDSSGELQYPFENDSAPEGTLATSGISYGHAEHADAADTAEWDRADQGSGRGCTVTIQSGTRYDHASTFKLYAYLRDLTFDADGHLLTVGPETRVEIDATEAC